jgi:hypothetical protein
MIRRIIKVAKIILFLRQIDGLCFKKRAGIKLTPLGAIWYHNEAKVPGDPLGKEFYSVPIFFKTSYEPQKIAIHEVRHRVQWNYPGIRLLTSEDLPISMRSQIRYDILKKMSSREIDAQTFEEIALPFFVSGQINTFIELMFGKRISSRES